MQPVLWVKKYRVNVVGFGHTMRGFNQVTEEGSGSLASLLFELVVFVNCALDN